MGVMLCEDGQGWKDDVGQLRRHQSCAGFRVSGTCISLIYGIVCVGEKENEDYSYQRN